MRQRLLVLGLGLLGSVGCFLNACDKNNSGQVAGPGVSVHCNAEQLRAALSPPSGNGDTSVRVTCPPAALATQGVDP